MPTEGDILACAGKESFKTEMAARMRGFNWCKRGEARKTGSRGRRYPRPERVTARDHE